MDFFPGGRLFWRQVISRLILRGESLGKYDEAFATIEKSTYC